MYMFMYITCSVHVHVHVYMYSINSINSEKKGGGGRLAIYIKIHPWAFTRAGAFARAVTVLVRAQTFLFMGIAQFI